MLRTDAIEVVYPNGNRALNPISLRLQPGTFTVLLGASGAGKSTLLRCLNGLITPTKGRVIVDCFGDISRKRVLRAHQRRTGMIFQQHHLIGRLSVLRNVLMGRLGYHSSASTLFGWRRRDKDLALAAIARVGLIEQALTRVDQLSGGQQQRVGIARALVQKPQLILADEPIASLDPTSAERVLSLLHRICKSDGLTAVVSLHQVSFARAFADRIIGLQVGCIAFDIPSSQIDDGTITMLYGRCRPERETEATMFRPQELTGTFS